MPEFQHPDARFQLNNRRIKVDRILDNLSQVILGNIITQQVLSHMKGDFRQRA